MKANQSIKGTRPGDEAAPNGMNLAVTVLVAVIVLVIGTSLVTTIADEAQGAEDSANVTGATASLVDLIPLIFVAGLVIAALGLFFTRKL